MITVQQFYFADSLGNQMSLNDLFNEEPQTIVIEYYDDDDLEETECEEFKESIDKLISWLSQTDTGYIHRATDRLRATNDNGEYVEDIFVRKIDFKALYEGLDLGIIQQFLSDNL